MFRLLLNIFLLILSIMFVTASGQWLYSAWEAGAIGLFKIPLFILAIYICYLMVRRTLIAFIEWQTE